MMFDHNLDLTNTVVMITTVFYLWVAFLYAYKVIGNIFRDTSLKRSAQIVDTGFAILIAPFWLILCLYIFVKILLEDEET